MLLYRGLNLCYLQLGQPPLNHTYGNCELEQVSFLNLFLTMTLLCSYFLFVPPVLMTLFPFCAPVLSAGSLVLCCGPPLTWLLPVFYIDYSGGTQEAYGPMWKIWSRKLILFYISLLTTTKSSIFYWKVHSIFANYFSFNFQKTCMYGLIWEPEFGSVCLLLCQYALF